jgi:hypothetical protein
MASSRKSAHHDPIGPRDSRPKSASTSPIAGYSGTPLAAKLGFKPGLRIACLGAPPDYRDLLAPLPEGVEITTRVAKPIDGIHLFVTERAALAKALPSLMRAISQDGFIWISWRKKSSPRPPVRRSKGAAPGSGSGVVTDITEQTIRDVALPLGLVDVKVCAVDDTWSGLRLVIRKELRKR